MQINCGLCVMWGRDVTSVNPLFTGRTSIRSGQGHPEELFNILTCFTAVPDKLGLPQTDMEHEFCLAMLSMGMSVITPWVLAQEIMRLRGSGGFLDDIYLWGTMGSGKMWGCSWVWGFLC